MDIIQEIETLRSQGFTGPQIVEKIRPWCGGDMNGDEYAVMKRAGYGVNYGSRWVSDFPLERYDPDD